MNLKDKSVIVTGGANGIGKATVRALLSKECKVNIVDIVTDDLKKTLQEFQDQFGEENVTSSTADVTSDSELRASFDHSFSLFGGVHIVINNAGILSERQWQRMVQVNLGGAVRGTELSLEYMSPDKGGVIVNIASIAGTEGVLSSRPFSLMPVYSATKAGVLAYSRCMAVSKEARDKRIQICCLCPDSTSTSMLIHPAAGETTRDPQLFRALMALATPVSPDVVAEKVISLVERDDVNGSVAVMNAEGDMSFQ